MTNDLTGLTFGIYQVVERAGSTKHDSIWLVRCRTCGTEQTRKANNLKQNPAKTCKHKVAGKPVAPVELRRFADMETMIVEHEGVEYYYGTGSAVYSTPPLGPVAADGEALLKSLGY